MLNHTLIKRTLASGLAIAAVGAPATAQAALMPAEGAPPSAPAMNPTATSAARTGSGFDWGDAGIGAAAVTVLLGTGALGAGATRRRRPVVG
jgi:hypothetical protein